MDNITAFIFARGGSKGVKDKNIRLVGGKPLIHHSIECAKATPAISKVVVSTDSEKIAEVAAAAGAEVLMRPPELAQDDSPEILAWRHAIDKIKPDLFISLPATSPLRNAEDVEAAIERYKENKWDIIFGITPSRRNPYLNMVSIQPDESIKVVCETGTAMRRQDVPDVFDITTCVYVSSPNYILKTDRLVDGKVGYITIPPERSIDIDDEYDLYLADIMLNKPKPEVKA